MTPTTDPDCSTGTTENGVCQPVGGMTPTDLAPADCQEDEPCWDCTTMGNRICGPEVPEVPERGDRTTIEQPTPCAADQTEVSAGICVDTDAVFPSTAPPAPAPAPVALPETGAALIGAELALATTLVAAGAALRRWAR